VKRALWLFIAMVLACAGAAAQRTAGQLAIGNNDRYPLSRLFTFLEDEPGQLTLEDVLKPQTQARFSPVGQSGSGANFGLTNSVHWLRVALNVSEAAPAEWLFEIDYPLLDHFELFVPQGEGFSRQVGGDTHPFAQRAVPHRNHIVPVRLVPGQVNVLYLRVQTYGTLAVPATLWQPRALWQHDLASYGLLSLYFGLLIGLLLYNLLLFFSVRERAYLIYVAFVGCMGIAQASITGVGAQYLWSGWTWWIGVSPPASLSIAAMLGMQFARSFLSSPQRMPSFDRLLFAWQAGWILYFIVAVFRLIPGRPSATLGLVMAVGSVVTMVTVGVVSIRREFAGARSFFTAWALLLVSVLTLALHNIGAIPSNVLTANAVLFGSALEMVLLSFALGDRINVARRFKEQAQARIAAEHAMVEALEESQVRLRRVLEEREVVLQNSLVGIAFLTPTGRFRWANKAMLGIFGADARAGASMEPYYLSRDHYLEVGRDVAKAVARGEVFETELQMRRADGRQIWVLLSGKAVNVDDTAQGTVWVIMNITQRKLLEEQLQKTNSEREAILNNTVVGIVLSVQRRHEWVNEKFAQMLGYPRQILIGQLSMYIHPDVETWERFGAVARATLIETGSYICEMELKRRNGELFWVEMGGSCVRPNDPDSGVIWTFLDITQRKASEIEMREALEQQKALNELRSRFVAMTSHEFRTPLAQILSAEQLLRHYGERLPQAERADVLDSIAAGVQRMTRMMDRVMLLGKADAGMLEFEPQRVHLAKLCRQLVDEARAQQPGASSEIVLEFDENEDEGVFDEKLLRHIFGNLLSNALKYSPAGGTVRFAVHKNGASTVFDVQDHGIGIPPEEIGDLFESFHRASNVGAIQGTGLGLAIVKNAVEKHGGTIGVESTLGAGTTFRVTLPA
jgi:PAS domain S-box-containing protein